MWKEGYLTAKALTSAGFAAFVLEYTLEPRQCNGWAKSVLPALREALVALGIMRQSMVKLGVNAPKLFVVGFSAGGHLAMSLCQRIRNLPEGFAHLRPSGVVLAYPAVVNPLCRCIYKHIGKRSPLLRKYHIPQENHISTNVEHKWCDIDAAALALPKCLVVASFGDVLLPPSANSDLLVQRLRHHHGANYVEYLCGNYGNHGFLLNGWEGDLIRWLDSQ
jgi:acetyl esterase/lipase